jgi:hypothetical protein
MTFIDGLIFAAIFIVAWFLFPLTRSVSNNFRTSPIMYFGFRVVFSAVSAYLVNYFFVE